MRGPLTEIAHAAVSKIASQAMKNGQDVWQELNRVGLLATEPRKQEIELAALKNMRDRLMSMSEDDLLRAISWHQGNSNPATNADLLRAVNAWVDTYIDYIAHD